MALSKEILDECCESLQKYSYNCIQRAGGNGLVVCKYIVAMKKEKDLSINYRKTVIANLSRLSLFHKNKPFEKMTEQDIVAFLDKYRKSDADDPMHQWKGTHNSLLTYFISFFKWLYYPNEKVRPKPDVVNKIGRKKRLEPSIYGPHDLWTHEDDNLFLKYCNSKRLKCYHIVSRDTSARPGEICKLKIKDIQFRQNGDGTYFAECLVNGKTGSRHVPLINSIPYIKDYLDHEHPQPTIQESAFIAGLGKSCGRNLSPNNMGRFYDEQKKAFSSLCNSPNVPPQDKHKIANLLKKPWNPYIRRHTALTEKSLNPKILPVLKQHAGWKQNSNMPAKYLHYFSNQSNNALLEAYGILPENSNNGLSICVTVKPCPQCKEPNTPDARFCAKCRMVLKYDGYKEAKEKEDEKEQGIKALQNQSKALENQMNQMHETIQDIKQTHNEFTKFMREHETCDDKGLAEVMKIFPRGNGKYKYEEVIERFRDMNK